MDDFPSTSRNNDANLRRPKAGPCIFTDQAYQTLPRKPPQDLPNYYRPNSSIRFGERDQACPSQNRRNEVGRTALSQQVKHRRQLGEESFTASSDTSFFEVQNAKATSRRRLAREGTEAAINKVRGKFGRERKIIDGGHCGSRLIRMKGPQSCGCVSNGGTQAD